MWTLRISHVLLSCLAPLHLAAAFTTSCAWETGIDLFGWSFWACFPSLGWQGWGGRWRPMLCTWLYFVHPMDKFSDPKSSLQAQGLRRLQAQWCSRRLHLRVEIHLQTPSLPVWELREGDEFLTLSSVLGSSGVERDLCVEDGAAAKMTSLVYGLIPPPGLLLAVELLFCCLKFATIKNLMVQRVRLWHVFGLEKSLVPGESSYDKWDLNGWVKQYKWILPSTRKPPSGLPDLMAGMLLREVETAEGTGRSVIMEQ